MKKISKFIFYLGFIPIIYFLEVLKFFFNLKFVEVDSSRLGHTSQFIEGFLCFNQDIKNKKNKF